MLMPPYYPAPRPRATRAARPAALAILYPKVGTVLRVPLRRTPTAGAAGCQQHPERQFMRWFNRMSAARPGFPMQLKSILLLTSEPLCADCRQALTRFLGQYRLAGKLRVRSLGQADCSCATPSAYQPALLWLDELLSETEPPAAGPVLLDVGSATATASAPPAKPVKKHRSPEFQRAKADLKRQSIDNPDLPRADRGWLRQERNQRGDNARRWRNPPGKDVGHIDPTDNKRVRWEESGQNRSRGGKFKREMELGAAAY